ncbi:MAG TPA: hypothetical protein VGL56_00160 [Fimbriimonadaceae bacterium]
MREPNANWTEGELEFNFETCSSQVWRPESLSRHLKAPDFVAPYDNETWIIEVKNPEAAKPLHRPGEIKAMIKSLQNDALAKEHLLPKLYGIYVYCAMTGQVMKAPIRYAAVIGVTDLDAALRSNVTNILQKVIDAVGPLDRITGFAPVAEVHSVESWNNKFHDKAISRLA